MDDPPVSIKWSNDDQYLAVLYGNHTIISIDMDSSQQYTVAPAPGADAKLSIPTWSPTDDRIYFALRENPQAPTMLYSATRRGAKLRTIAELGAGFDPDDRRQSIYGIYGDRPPPGHGFYVSEIQISPDGKAILFAAVLPGQDDAVYLIDTDGNNLRQVVRNAKLRSRSAVYNDDAEKSVTLYTMSPNGGAVPVLIRRGALTPGSAEPIRP